MMEGYRQQVPLSVCNICHAVVSTSMYYDSLGMAANTLFFQMLSQAAWKMRANCVKFCSLQVNNFPMRILSEVYRRNSIARIIKSLPQEQHSENHQKFTVGIAQRESAKVYRRDSIAYKKMIQGIENFKNNIKKGSATFFKFQTVQCLFKIVQIQKDCSKS